MTGASEQLAPKRQSKHQAVTLSGESAAALWSLIDASRVSDALIPRLQQAARMEAAQVKPELVDWVVKLASEGVLHLGLVEELTGMVLPTSHARDHLDRAAKPEPKRDEWGMTPEEASRLESAATDAAAAMGTTTAAALEVLRKLAEAKRPALPTEPGAYSHGGNVFVFSGVAWRSIGGVQLSPQRVIDLTGGDLVRMVPEGQKLEATPALIAALPGLEQFRIGTKAPRHYKNLTLAIEAIRAAYDLEGDQ